MSQLAVGIIETIGLAACIEAADACVKSANVELIGYELSKGGGMAVLKIEGNVGAVNAAVDAGVVAANKVSKVFSYKVIARPSDCIENLIRSNDTVGYTKGLIGVKEHDVKEHDVKEVEIKEDIDKEDRFQEILTEEHEDNVEEDYYTCNICKDPECSRQKGELKTNCIHYKESNEN